MSTRERWIVYPLLFLTLGIALRDKVIPPVRLGNLRMQFEAGAITTPQIRCNQLHVGKVVCERLDAKQSECRALLVNGPSGRPVVVVGADPKTHAGIVETFTDRGLPQVRLHSSNTGGVISTIGRAGRLVLAMGDTGQNFGVFAELPELGQIIPLTLPWRFGTKPVVPQPSNKPAAQQKSPLAPDADKR